VLILVAERAGFLSATIRSRCQQLAFVKPPHELAVQWLRERLPDAQDVDTLLTLANGAPLRALELHETDGLALHLQILEGLEKLHNRRADPVSIAAAWLKGEHSDLLHGMHTWLVDMVRIKALAHPLPHLKPDIRSRLQGIVKQLELTTLFEYMDIVKETRRLATRFQLQPQLALEDLLTRWSLLPGTAS
jgi:DNA polymerase-3 subunit delta'